MTTTAVVGGKPCGFGPDISVYQPGSDVGPAFASGESIVVLKQTEGVGFIDPWFTRHRASAIKSGGRWESYHFARPKNNPITEADWAVQIAVAYPGMRRVWLDFEVDGGTGDWALTWLDRVQSRLSNLLTPGVYTGKYVKFDRPQRLASFPLWLAAYTSQPIDCAPWGMGWSAWQYTDKAVVPGITTRCDRSAWTLDYLGSAPQPNQPVLPEDDMPYSETQLRQMIREESTAADVAVASFIARDPRDGGMWIFTRGMERRHLDSPDQVTLARTQLGIPFLRGDDPNTSQDMSGALVDLYVVNPQPVTATLTLTPDELSSLVAQISAGVLDGASRRLAS